MRHPEADHHLVSDQLAAEPNMLTALASQRGSGGCCVNESNTAAADGQGSTRLDVVILFVVLVADIDIQVCELEPRAAVQDLACQDDAIPAGIKKPFSRRHSR